MTKRASTSMKNESSSNRPTNRTFIKQLENSILEPDKKINKATVPSTRASKKGRRVQTRQNKVRNLKMFQNNSQEFNIQKNESDSSPKNDDMSEEELETFKKS